VVVENAVLILVTVSSLQEGEKIGEALVKEGLAACTNLVPGIQSIFRWKGEICREGEVLMLIKSNESLFDELQYRVKELHSYDVPEIIALPIILGSLEYLKWVDEVLKTKNPKS
jgi:periplasmic divalent cation tolerance protein